MHGQSELMMSGQWIIEGFSHIHVSDSNIALDKYVLKDGNREYLMSGCLIPVILMRSVNCI